MPHDGNTPIYLMLNYEQFQQRNRQALVHFLLTFRLDFVVFDEIQLVKQRSARASNRRSALETLLTQAEEHSPNLCVLGLSATPVINNLLEGKKLLELVTGRAFPDIDARHQTANNALKLHRALMQHGFRTRPRSAQRLNIKLMPVIRNDLYDLIKHAQRSSPVGTGLDGLQAVCKRIIFLSLPWTGAEFEQIIGRIHRQGSPFDTVDIVVSQILFSSNGETWSWDQVRMRIIETKQALCDCVLDGHLPQAWSLSERDLHHQDASGKSNSVSSKRDFQYPQADRSPCNKHNINEVLAKMKDFQYPQADRSHCSPFVGTVGEKITITFSILKRIDPIATRIAWR